MVKIVILIPARGGSKRVPRKNMKLLKKKPLIWYAINAAKQSFFSLDVWVSTEDEEIKKYAISQNVKVLDRPMELAGDTSTVEEVMMHFTEKINYDIIILVEPTYPLIQPEDISKSLHKFVKNKYDSLLTLQNKKLFLWNYCGISVTPANYNIYRRPRMQDFKGALVEEGGIFITSRKNFIESKCRLTGLIGYHLIEHPSIDVDNEIDFKIAEAIL